MQTVPSGAVQRRSACRSRGRDPALMMTHPEQRDCRAWWTLVAVRFTYSSRAQHCAAKRRAVSERALQAADARGGPDTYSQATAT